MVRKRKTIKNYEQYRDTCQLTTLCDVCQSKEDCAVFRLMMDAKQVAWDHHRHSIRWDIPACSHFIPSKTAQRFDIV